MKLYHIIFIGILLLLTACQTDGNNKSEKDKLLIYTSVYPIQYVIEEIAGDKADVDSIYPPGVDAHTYEPSSREITELANGDALIYLGAGMESFAETTVDALASQDIDFIELGQYKELFSSTNKTTEHAHGDFDPHIWLDPSRMIEIGDLLKEALTKLSPKDEALFEENFASFEQNMQQLDDLFQDTLVDKENKEILVTHAAYGYWEERYGIEQIAISGLSSSDEPSQKELAAIAKEAKEKQIHYVIFETSTSNRVASIIQEHIGAEKLRIHNLEVLTEEEIEEEKDYLSLMKENLKTLDKALQNGGD